MSGYSVDTSNPDDPRHGTRSFYSNQGCRCEACRAVHADEHVRLRGKTPPTHGRSGYSNYACRCLVCTTAQAEYQRALRARRTGGAS